MSNNYLSILELSYGASEDDIKKAYKKLALKYHPDRNSEEGAEEKFKKISEAYQILTGKSEQPQSRMRGANGAFMNANDLFAQFFNNSQGLGSGSIFMNINPQMVHQMHSVGSSGQNIRHINIGNMPQVVHRSSKIQYTNETKIETITEIINGQILKKTNITKLR